MPSTQIRLCYLRSVRGELHRRETQFWSCEFNSIDGSSNKKNSKYLYFIATLLKLSRMGSHRPLGGRTGTGWKRSHFVLKKTIARLKLKQPAFHPGPVQPPSVDGFPFPYYPIYYIFFSTLNQPQSLLFYLTSWTCFTRTQVNYNDLA